MANKVLQENYIFPIRHIPNCFTNVQILDNLEIIKNAIGITDEIITLSFIKDGNKIKEYKGYEDKVYGHKKGTEPININISKPNGGNRFVCVSNPLALIPLDLYMTENINEILTEQLDSNDKYYSSSHYEYDEEGIVVGTTYDGEAILEENVELIQQGFDNKELITHKICSGRYYHMSIDISDFFNSIYSHSVSWDLVNNQNKDIFENIDVLSRTLNKNETKGILIGPYTSGIISEVILSKIDRKIVEKYQDDDVSFVHYCDDYDFFSNSKEKLESDVKNFVGKCFLEYGLNLNLYKYKIEEFPFISLKNIQTEKIFILKNRIKDKDFDKPLDYVENVMNDLTALLNVKYSNCNYLLAILNSLYIQNEIPEEYRDRETSMVLLDFLINMMFKNNLVSRPASSLIISIFEKLEYTLPEKEKILDKWVNKIESCKSQLKEITDIWLQFIILKLDCCTETITQYMLDILGNGVLQDIMTLEYLDNNDLIDINSQKIIEYLNNIETELNRRFGNEWKQAAYDTKYWLIFYTNSIRWKLENKPIFRNTVFDELNIHNLVGVPAMPGRLKIFDILYQNNIEFYVNERHTMDA